ncbi:MAG TPA: hypothetical protein VKD91_02955 [Pyrinomonadaceae bacterium]|nr:hypothetical protein [Pyrinomonadaceae bacterium]
MSVSNRIRTQDMTRSRICTVLAPLLVIAFLAGPIAKGDSPNKETAKLLPDSLQSFRATGPASEVALDGIWKQRIADPSVVTSTITRTYRSESGEISVQLATTEKDSAAYALLAELAAQRPISTGKVGIASVDFGSRILFYKGSNIVQIEWSGRDADGELWSVAHGLADTLPAGDDEIPVLTQHLPNGLYLHPLYAVSLQQLKSFLGNQPVIDAVSFEGGTEAVVANYGQAQLVIVEFTTPQFSIDTDQRIWTKIAELKSKGNPTPSAYRRVGNYSVFVFNAADEKTANALIDQVKYEQVVQWLGDDPHLYERLQRYFAQTSAGVLVAVLKSSGLSLLICLVAGALIGAMLFRHRRAQRAAAFSDAGGSIRLNLDDLTGPVAKRPLLAGNKKSEADSTHS